MRAFGEDGGCSHTRAFFVSDMYIHPLNKKKVMRTRKRWKKYVQNTRTETKMHTQEQKWWLHGAYFPYRDHVKRYC